MSSVPASAYLTLAIILFCIGLFGALTKRNTVIVLVCIELMLNAANLNLVAFSKLGLFPNLTGQIFSVYDGRSSSGGGGRTRHFNCFIP